MNKDAEPAHTFSLPHVKSLTSPPHPRPRVHPFTRTQNVRGHTPLHFAYAYGYEELGEYLVKKGGADANIRNVYGLTCFEGLGIKTPLTGGHR